MVKAKTGFESWSLAGVYVKIIPKTAKIVAIVFIKIPPDLNEIFSH